MSNTTPSTSLRNRLALARFALAPLCALLLAVVGCGDDAAPAPATDASTTDLGGDDASLDDGGGDDASTFDAATGDAGAEDAGADDAGGGDAGADDAGGSDAGGGDAGGSDAGGGDAGGSDAGGPGMCTLRPRTGCCFADSDCTGPRERCVGSVCDASGEGVCKSDPPGPDTCWDDKDCRSGTTCMSANICPCGAACFVADRPGVCVPTI